MFEKLIILVICLILLSVTAEFKASNIATYNDDVTIVTHEKIVGGHAVSITDYPYQLSLQLNYMHICGASIIADKWALTAAHCTYSVPSSNLSVRAGTSFRGYGGQIIDIKRVHEHPKYHPDKLDYDISVLELLEPVNINSAKRIHMASWYNFLFPWLEGVVTGWGHSKENGTLTWQLQAVKLPVINHYRCSLAYGGVVSGNMFCAGYPAGKKDSCQGDSGGPLAINGRLYGIVSFGMGCARPGYPGVYVRVSEFRGFIYSVCGV